MRSLRRIAGYLGATAVIAWIFVALSVAQTVDQPAAAAPSDLGAAAAPPGSGSGGDLADRLDRSGGVIRPPAGVDPGLTQTPPQTGSSRMPVIPPPGTAGGDTDVDPR